MITYTCQLFTLRVDVYIGRDLLIWEFLVSNEPSRRVSDKNTIIIAILLHPGNVKSSPGPWNIDMRFLLRLVSYDVAYGARRLC